MVLSILCDFEGKDKQMVVNTIIKKLLKLSKEELLEYMQSRKEQ